MIEKYLRLIDFSKAREADYFYAQHAIEVVLKYAGQTQSYSRYRSGAIDIYSDKPSEVEIFFGQKGWDIDLRPHDRPLGERSLATRFLDRQGEPIVGFMVTLRRYKRHSDKLIAEMSGATDSEGWGPVIEVKLYNHLSPESLNAEKIKLFVTGSDGKESRIWSDWPEYLAAKHTQLVLRSGLIKVKDPVHLIKSNWTARRENWPIYQIKAGETLPPLPQAIATMGDCAAAANAAYEEIAPPQLAGWENVKQEVILPEAKDDMNQRAYKVDTYYHQASGELMIANRGTVMSLRSNLRADGTLAIGQKPEIARLAEKFVVAAFEHFGSAKIKHVHLTGHSLGGALAQWQTLKLDQHMANKNLQNIPITCIGFNAPGIHGGSRRLGHYESYDIVCKGDVFHTAGFSHISRTKEFTLDYGNPAPEDEIDALAEKLKNVGVQLRNPNISLGSVFILSARLQIYSDQLQNESEIFQFRTAARMLAQHSMAMLNQGINASHLGPIPIDVLNQLEEADIHSLGEGTVYEPDALPDTVGPDTVG